MDPNANLAEQSRLVDHVAKNIGGDSRADKRRLAELRHALRAWLASGGFQPDWDYYPEATTAYIRWTR